MPRMSETAPKRRLKKPMIALMAAIDIAALAIAIWLYLFLQPRDLDAAIMAVVASIVVSGFFNLVIVLVSLKP